MQLTARDKRLLQVVGILAGLALAWFLVTAVFGGGGDEGEVAIPTGPTAVVPPVEPTVSPTPTETLPPVVLAGARDPFSTPPELATSTAVPTSGVPTSPPVGGGTTTPPPTFPGGPGTTTVTTTSSTTTTTTSSTTTTTSTSTTGPGNGNGNGDGDGDGDEPTNRITIGERDLRLVGVLTKQDMVEIFVDRRLYTVEENATFEEVFKLVKIQRPDCARFLFGDQGFTLCLPD